MAYHVFFVGEADAVGVGHAGHVGEDDFVAFFEPVQDLDGIHRRAAKLDVGSHRFCAIVDDLKEVHGGVLGAIHGASDIENVVQPFDLDGGIDFRDISRSGANPESLRQGAINRDVDGASVGRGSGTEASFAALYKAL